jgi:hypothetical protein
MPDEDTTRPPQVPDGSLTEDTLTALGRRALHPNEHSFDVLFRFVFHELDKLPADELDLFRTVREMVVDHATALLMWSSAESRKRGMVDF